MPKTTKKCRDFQPGEVITVRGTDWTITRLVPYGDSEHSLIVCVKRYYKGKKITDSFAIDKAEEWEVQCFPEYKVGTFRDAGLKAKWTRTSKGAPIIAVWHEKHDCWYLIDNDLWKFMCNEPLGLKVGFKMAHLIADIFSIPA